jgi:NMD protein affecting ribosome stability and mRNA decay
MPLNAKFNKLINDPDMHKAFVVAVQARNAYWDDISELETLTGCTVESEDFQSCEEEGLLYFLQTLEESDESQDEGTEEDQLICTECGQPVEALDEDEVCEACRKK